MVCFKAVNSTRWHNNDGWQHVGVDLDVSGNGGVLRILLNKRERLLDPGHIPPPPPSNRPPAPDYRHDSKGPTFIRHNDGTIRITVVIWSPVDYSELKSTTSQPPWTHTTTNMLHYLFSTALDCFFHNWDTTIAPKCGATKV
jgi:hypothetical protein